MMTIRYLLALVNWYFLDICIADIISSGIPLLGHVGCCTTLLQSGWIPRKITFDR